MGVDVLGWVQTVNPPDFDLPRKENPRRKHSDANNEVPYSVRSAYCGPCMVRAPEIRLAHSCGSLVNCAAEHSVIFPDKTELKTHVQKFKRRDLKKSEDKKRERAEQRIIDLLTVKAALSVLRESCWYWGNISGEKAKSLLNGASPGTFLIRDSSDRRYLFSMSVMTRQGPTSIRLIFSKGTFRVESSGLISPRSPCVVSLILRMSHLAATRTGQSVARQIPEEDDNIKIEHQNGTFPKPYRSALLEKPLYSKVPDLKHFARLVINRFNLRNYTESRDIEYIRAYPYPI